MKRKTISTLMIITAICVMLSITAWAVWSIHKAQTPVRTLPVIAPSAQNDDVFSGEIPIGDYERTKKALQEKVDASKFEVKINSCITKDDTGKYVALIGNTARNRYNCYVYIADPSGNVLYTSPTIEPGQYIPYITITKHVQNMDADAYFCVLDDTRNLIGKVAVGIKLKG